MNNFGVEVFVAKAKHRMGYEVWITKQLDDRRSEIWYYKGDIVEREVIEYGAAFKGPSMFLEEFVANGIVEGLSKIGIKPQQGYLEGKIEATEKHLADTRKLLKLN